MDDISHWFVIQFYCFLEILKIERKRPVLDNLNWSKSNARSEGTHSDNFANKFWPLRKQGMPDKPKRSRRSFFTKKCRLLFSAIAITRWTDSHNLTKIKIQTAAEKYIFVSLLWWFSQKNVLSKCWKNSSAADHSLSHSVTSSLLDKFPRRLMYTIFLVHTLSALCISRCPCLTSYTLSESCFTTLNLPLSLLVSIYPMS